MTAYTDQGDPELSFDELTRQPLGLVRCLKCGVEAWFEAPADAHEASWGVAPDFTFQSRCPNRRLGLFAGTGAESIPLLPSASDHHLLPSREAMTSVTMTSTPLSGKAPTETVFTAGYGGDTIDGLLARLKIAGVTHVADVRSNPFSGRRPEFNGPELQAALKIAGINYFFLGDELGGRPKDAGCYTPDGRVDFTAVRERDWFRDGLERIMRGVSRHFTLMPKGSRSNCSGSYLQAGARVAWPRFVVARITADASALAGGICRAHSSLAPSVQPMLLTSLIGNGSSVVYNPLLGIGPLTESIVGAFSVLAGTDAAAALAAFANQVKGNDRDDFEGLLGPLDAITQALPILGGAAAPFANVGWVAGPLAVASEALRRLHRLGLATALGLIAARTLGQGQDALEAGVGVLVNGACSPSSLDPAHVGSLPAARKGSGPVLCRESSV